MLFYNSISFIGFYKIDEEIALLKQQIEKLEQELKEWKGKYEDLSASKESNNNSINNSNNNKDNNNDNNDNNNNNNNASPPSPEPTLQVIRIMPLYELVPISNIHLAMVFSLFVPFSKCYPSRMSLPKKPILLRPSLPRKRKRRELLEFKL